MEHEAFEADPQQLQAEAEKEPARRGLQDYLGAIKVLKEEKDFSFREIADWLRQRGLDVDHNAVWRAYAKAMPGSSESLAKEQSERSEQAPAHGGAMPWLEESAR